VHLTQAVERMLTDASFKDTARRYRDILTSYDGPKAAARLICKYIGDSAAPPGS
jgi:UDP:flavonoid glycosyltransferase YjiC (YdhE family)